MQPYLWYYALVGTGLALEAIIITALASAYITAINRFSKDESMTYNFTFFPGESEEKKRSTEMEEKKKEKRRKWKCEDEL